jgi:arginase family enzyme
MFAGAIADAATAYVDQMARSVEALRMHIDLDCLDDSYGRATPTRRPAV